METTMIQIKKDTANILKSLKQYKRESYDEVIKDLIEDVQAEYLTEKEKKDVEEALEDVKAGRVRSIEKAAKEMGVRLRA